MTTQYFELLREFVVTDFKLRYKHSLLGFVWVILKPLALFLILYIVWSAFLAAEKGYEIYLLSGVMIMNFIDDSVLFGLQSLFTKAHILLKVNFPREVLLFSSLTVALANGLINAVVFVIIVTIFNSWSAFDLSFQGIALSLSALIVLVMLLLGIGFFSSILYVRFRDIDHLATLLLRLLFWGTPVIYELGMLNSRPVIKSIISNNPITIILESVRQGLLHGSSIQSTNWLLLSYVFIGAVIIMISGFWFFRNNISKVAEDF